MSTVLKVDFRLLSHKKIGVRSGEMSQGSGTLELFEPHKYMYLYML